MSRRLLFLFPVFWLLATASSAQSQRTDLNLVIAMDCSWSVDSVEYALQVGGVSEVFSDPEIVAAIKANRHGRIAVTIMHWSTHRVQKIALPWTVISSERDASRVAKQVASLSRLTTHGGTSIAGALLFGRTALASAPYSADRYVIDVIADGENNDGSPVQRVRDQVIRDGTTVNALGVVNVVSSLHDYLRENVIGGPGAFVERAADYKDFRRAFKRKLLREIKGDPVTELPVRRAVFP